ncbi:MAG: hypothetical protein KA375_13040 [Vitreoscilla sp.]|nr:hypothetical protein [Burkholderiales bacterium]MBP6338517.1 hypothetical protein [Vitreoscilla sp.]MBP6674882.1 hypothetical protein [Vitreoscilla sp.]
MDFLILLIATLACGAADALGFVHSARVWQGGSFQGREALLSAVCFQFGVSMYWVALRTLSAWGVVSTEAQTLVWFAATIIGVAILSGQFLRWQALDQSVAIAVLVGIAWLLARTGGSA